ncbi:MAG: RelA/SpoT family protein [Bacteroidales bacterium]|nr:RelA/SpoT family protein [Bacteroidales bacterium]
MINIRETDIINALDRLSDHCRKEYDRQGMDLISKSIEYVRSKLNEYDSKEQYASLIQSLDLAEIAIIELGLDPLGVSAALLLPLVEHDESQLYLLKKRFNDRVLLILKELVKIKNLDTGASSRHAENMRNLILSLSTDFRVILLKISERLSRLRRLDELSDEEAIVAANESKAIYSPLAHRLGLYKIMSELDDISMQILEREIYESITNKLKASKVRREKFIKEFIAPIQERLEKEKFKFEIFGRPKAISSIWRKMQKQNVELEEVYDKFAIRIILDSSPRKEKSDCWRVYSIITDIYQPNPDRMRDWISVPKSNGYESLHTTVIGLKGEWVEIQIRSRRMNDIAEKGLAAHWRYKGLKGQASVDDWLVKVRDALENADNEESANIIDDLKISQFNKEIFVFTPNGDLKKFPENATVLDFAYDIHTDIGASCVGARVNGKNVPIRHVLKNGDKVEIITSKKQKAKVDWLNFIVTSKAKTKIKQSLKEEKLKESENGRELLKRRFKNWKIEYNDSNVRKVIQHFKYKDSIDLHHDVATEKIDLLAIKEIFSEKEDPGDSKPVPIKEKQVEQMINSAMSQSDDFLVIDEKIANIDYKLAKCCKPIHGDSVFGFVTRTSGISIHRTNCPNAHQLLTRYGYRVVKAQWTQAADDTRFEVSIRITGIDDLGIVSNISDVISKDLQVNMRSISIDSNDGMFEGTAALYVKDTQHLEALIRKLKKVKGVSGVRRTG